MLGLTNHFTVVGGNLIPRVRMPPVAAQTDSGALSCIVKTIGAPSQAERPWALDEERRKVRSCRLLMGWQGRVTPWPPWRMGACKIYSPKRGSLLLPGRAGDAPVLE